MFLTKTLCNLLVVTSVLEKPACYIFRVVVLSNNLWDFKSRNLNFLDCENLKSHLKINYYHWQHSPRGVEQGQTVSLEILIPFIFYGHCTQVVVINAGPSWLMALHSTELCKKGMSCGIKKLCCIFVYLEVNAWTSFPIIILPIINPKGRIALGCQQEAMAQLPASRPNWMY
jgi:hypothetical protein